MAAAAPQRRQGRGGGGERQPGPRSLEARRDRETLTGPVAGRILPVEARRAFRREGPGHMTPEAFLGDIIEHPDDDAPRLVYADWLDENGNPERAEFIRAQVRLVK